jgi:hypothetical protein
MELPSVAALEFEEIKASIKNFIKTKTDFQDYDFEGSNLSMLVDVLSYNSMYSAYNINMAANELNLDTAVLRDNIVSHAKKLGYTPNSYTSSKITTNISVSGVSSYDSIEISPGTVFSTTQNNKSYTFISRDSIRLNPYGSNSVTFSNLTFVEGTEFTIEFVVDTSNENQRFFIPNSFIDASTIKVSIIADIGYTVEDEYTKTNSIVGISSSDKIFFVEEIQDQKYELIFGDNVIGRKLENGEIVRVRYIITNGSLGNNISNFNFIGSVKGQNPGVSDSTIPGSNITFELVSSKSDGGAEFEPIRSIKYRAPRYYAAQQRAVTTTDYESIIQNIYTNAELIRVSGGEEQTPPQYGKVLIYIKPKIGELLSEFEKQRITTEIKNYIVGSITPVIIDADSITLIIEPVVIYDSKKTKKSSSLIKSLIQKVISNFNETDEFKNFGGIYSSTKLLCQIEDIDTAIKFVLVKTYFKRLVSLYDNIEYNYKLDFYTKLKNRIQSKYTLISDAFCLKGVNEPVFLCSLSRDFAGCEDDNNIYISTISGRIIGVVGKIDYETGKINFVIRACQDTPINIYVIPVNPDITTNSSTYPTLQIINTKVVDTIDSDDNTLNPEVILPVPTTTTTGDSTGNPPYIDVPGTTVTNPDGSITTTNPDGSTTTTNPDGSTTNEPTSSTENGGATSTNVNATIDDFTPETPNTCT